MARDVYTSWFDTKTQRSSPPSGVVLPSGLYTRFTHVLILCVALFSAPVFAFDQEHRLLQQVLDRYLDSGRVDYQGLQANPQLLDEYLVALGGVERSDFDHWTEAERIAYWVNAYNAFTLKAIIDHYPIKRSTSWKALVFPSNSIWQIKGIWEGIKQPVVGGQSVALNDIEHEILRKEYKEPRIHMALVCASIGCPTLRDEVYRGDRLDAQLESQTQLYLNDASRGSALDGKRLRVSKIFDWFGEDFVGFADQGCYEKGGKQRRGVINFVHRYVDKDTQERICSQQPRLGYLDYDWHLNDQATEEQGP